MLHIFTLTADALCACHAFFPHYNLSLWACTCTLYELVTEKFNFVVSWTEVQPVSFAHHQEKKGNKSIQQGNLS